LIQLVQIMIVRTRNTAIMSICLAAICLAVLGSSGAMAAGCVGDLRFKEGRTHWSGSTRVNEVCTLHYGTRSDIVGYRVIRAPSHGTLGKAGLQGDRFLTAYKPHAGYVGPDSFAVQITYIPRATGVRSSTLLFMDMTVLP
jgi:hypothetical protein